MDMLDARATLALVQAGACLIDIRDHDEHRRERIPGAVSHPLARLGTTPLPRGEATVVVFHCRSGMRTGAHAARLVAAAGAHVRVCTLEGGLDAWKQAGLPVLKDRTQPLELNRQVQIAAGSLVLLATALGFGVSPWFHLLAGGIGAGLTFAGISGFCGLARLLARMPWNRRSGLPVSN